MKRIVFDANALMAYFKNEAGADTVEDYIQRCTIEGSLEGWLSPINHGDVLYMLTRKSGVVVADAAMGILQNLAFRHTDLTLERSLAAARIKAANRLSYADAFAAALTIELRGTLLTGDPELVQLKLPNYKVLNIRN